MPWLASHLQRPEARNPQAGADVRTASRGIYSQVTRVSTEMKMDPPQRPPCAKPRMPRETALQGVGRCEESTPHSPTVLPAPVQLKRGSVRGG